MAIRETDGEISRLQHFVAVRIGHGQSVGVESEGQGRCLSCGQGRAGEAVCDDLRGILHLTHLIEVGGRFVDFLS